MASTEGSELTSVNFNEILDVFKEQNNRIALYIVSIITGQSVTDILCTSVSISLLRFCGRGGDGL